MLVPISLLHVTGLPSLAIGWEATPLDFFLVWEVLLPVQ